MHCDQSKDKLCTVARVGADISLLPGWRPIFHFGQVEDQYCTRFSTIGQVMRANI